MSRTLTQMSTNVGTDVQDTSTAFASIINRFINRRYLQVMRAVNFDVIHSDYTISVVAGTADYALPTDFKCEVACIDQTNGTPLSRVDFSYFQRNDDTAFVSQGTVSRYIIYTDETGAGKIKFAPIPNQALTVAMPYIVKPTELTASDSPLLPIEDILEVGATADAWRYKRQFAKAQQFEMMFNSMFADFIFSQESQPNNPIKFEPTTFDPNDLY